MHELKSQGAEVILAVTHMRVPNDTKLAEQVEGIDVVLVRMPSYYYYHILVPILKSRSISGRT